MSQSSSYFTVSVIPPVLNPKRVTLKWLSIPNTFYNIRSRINNQIAFTDGSGAHVAIIPPAAYGLLTQLSTVMTNTGSQTYVASYNISS